MSIELLLQGTLEVFSIFNFLMMCIGVAVGIIFGALPGLSATMGLALLLPFTFTMTPSMGLITLAGIYIGAMYGGSVPALLINTPGTPSAIATTFDGFPLTQKGKAQEGLVTAAFASFVGSFFGTIVLVTSAGPLANVALSFGQAEYFWLAVFGLTIIASLSGDSLSKSLISGMIGVVLSFVGMSPITAEMRMTYDVVNLQAGINLAVFLVGIFCLPEVFSSIIGKKAQNYSPVKVVPNSKAIKGTLLELIKKPGLLIRSSILGTVIGFAPGAGGNIAGIISYNEAKRFSKTPEEYGTGIIDGVAASEAANSATAPSSAIPLLTLGIPGSPPAAMIIGVLMMHGMRPGPELFTSYGSVAAAFIMAMFFASAVVLVFGIFGSFMFPRLINISVEKLAPMIVFLTIVGTYAVGNNVWDVWLMVFFGLVGFLMRKYDIPAAPMALGFILAPFAEKGLNTAMMIGSAQGSVMFYLVQSSISKILIAFSVLSIAWPLISKILKKKGNTHD